MSLLQNIVGEVLKTAVQNQQSVPNQAQNQSNSGLGGLIGGIASAVGQSSNQSGDNNALGGLLGGVLGSNTQGGALESVLGGLLGGQNTNANPSDLGGVLAGVLGGSKGQFAQNLGSNKGVLLVALLPVVLSFIQKNGGLGGVLGKFSANGLDDKAKSWVNLDTDNDGLDAGDVARLFDDQQEQIEQVCQKTGVGKSEAYQGIADLLPKVMSDLTPNGDLSDENQANDEISQILSKLGLS